MIELHPTAAATVLLVGHGSRKRERATPRSRPSPNSGACAIPTGASSSVSSSTPTSLLADGLERAAQTHPDLNTGIVDFSNTLTLRSAKGRTDGFRDSSSRLEKGVPETRKRTGSYFKGQVQVGGPPTSFRMCWDQRSSSSFPFYQDFLPEGSNISRTPSSAADRTDLLFKTLRRIQKALLQTIGSTYSVVRSRHFFFHFFPSWDAPKNWFDFRLRSRRPSVGTVSSTGRPRHSISDSASIPASCVAVHNGSFTSEIIKILKFQN